MPKFRTPRRLGEERRQERPQVPRVEVPAG
jgi:hypothetical protein